MPAPPTGRRDDREDGDVVLHLRLARHPDGAISGSVCPADGLPEPFSGWLGLLALLERHAGPVEVPPTPDP